MTFSNKGGVNNASEARRKPLPRVCSQEREKKTYLGFSHSPSLKPRREGMERMAMQRERKRGRRQAEHRGAGVLELGDGDVTGHSLCLKILRERYKQWQGMEGGRRAKKEDSPATGWLKFVC